MRLITALIMAGLLAGCGGESEDTTTAKKETHILSDEQDLMKQAEGIQGLMDKDAEQKKKAMETSQD